jgi:hypothetical protein
VKWLKRESSITTFRSKEETDVELTAGLYKADRNTGAESENTVVCDYGVPAQHK